MSKLYPLRFAPIYKKYIWGGRRLETVFGRKLGPEPTYAESWEIADHPHGRSLVANGPLAGISLGELTATRSAELLGPDRTCSRFPVLLKFLDARENLSLQVHPDDAAAARMGLDDPGKTEAWVIIEAEPGSVIWSGFKRPTARRSVAEAVRNGTLESLLNRFEPAAGDCLFIPAGTVHSLGKGVLVAEIQQASDSTFRLFDWNRLGPDGTPRPLHVEEALETIDYGKGPVGPVRPRLTDRSWAERLVESDQFVLDRLKLNSPQMVGGSTSCHLITVLAGSISLESDGGPDLLELGQTALLPAALGAFHVTPQENMPATLLDTYLP